LETIKFPGRFVHFIQLFCWLSLHCDIIDGDREPCFVVVESSERLEEVRATYPTKEALDRWDLPRIATLNDRYSANYSAALIRRLIELCPYSDQPSLSALGAFIVHLFLLAKRSPPQIHDKQQRIGKQQLLDQLVHYVRVGTEENALVCLSIADCILLSLSNEVALQSDASSASTAQIFLHNLLPTTAKFLDVANKSRVDHAFSYIRRWFTDSAYIQIRPTITNKELFAQQFIVLFCVHPQSYVRQQAVSILNDLPGHLAAGPRAPDAHTLSSVLNSISVSFRHLTSKFLFFYKY
jgi:hypothetical protein